MTEQVAEIEVSTSDISTTDAPTTTEEAKVEVEKQEPETVTLTKAELDEQKNAVAAKERARAERKLQRELQAVEARFNEKLEASKETPKPIEGKPSLDKFDTYDEYIDALTDWKIEQKAVERDTKEKVESENLSRKQVMADHASREDKARTQFADYDDVAGNIADVDFTVNPDIGRTILTSDISPQLIYYFGKDLDELERINNLSPYAAAREIGKIEAKILSKPIQTSSAPSPISPVTGRSAESGLNDNLSAEEWIKRRNAQLNKR